VERCTQLAGLATRAARRDDERKVAGPGSAEDLTVATFSRTLDLAWRRSSYSSIVSGGRVSAELVVSEPENAGTFDEEHLQAELLASGAIAPELEQVLRNQPLVLSAVASSAAVGTFVHHLLELTDFARADLEAHVGEVIRSEWDRRPPELTDLDSLASGLVAAIQTPLGPLAGGVSLADIGRADRLDEVGFELPLAGGDTPHGAVMTVEIARLFSAHLDPRGPLLGYPERLSAPHLATDLRGYLTGSLDLVFRTRDATVKYFVADYKTNRLGGAAEAITSWDYRPEALDSAMQHAHYPLQAIIYTVALHRYLRWRLPGYDPESNLGGVLYLFLRGMTGSQCPVVAGHPCGVFSWRPPTELVVSLSDLFDLNENARER
jgi:exodeoxyribonuclease V beta subunit